MDSQLQAYLDGELPIEALPRDLRLEAEAWDALLLDIRASAPAGAPLGLDGRVESAIAGVGDRRRPSWLDWLFRPRPVPVPPAAVLAAAAALAVAILGPFRSGGDTAAGEARVHVQFVVEAPMAQSVHVVGDFNEWQPNIELEDADGDGVWSGRVALEPGVHEYMFVIDGSDWITDPNAAGYQDDGFGQRNAVVAVSPLDGT